MRIPIELTYNEVEKRHPTELKSLISDLRNSSSKMKDSDPAHMSFEYAYGLTCGILVNPRGTVDEKVADWMSRVGKVTLVGKLGKWRGYKTVPNPVELEQHFRSEALKEAEREKEWNSLSEEERLAERQKILRELSRDNGFITVGF